MARTSSRPAASPARAATGSTPAQGPKKRKGGWILNAGVITVATGIIATMSLPAFAFNPDGAENAAFGPSAADSMKKAQSQTVEVDGVASAAVSRDAASATTEEQLASQKAAAAAAAAAESARRQAAIQLTAYANKSTGPSVSDFLSNPPYPNFSLSQVFSVAQQYIGTPYVYGGASPAGFDCSGYVMYVYAQFGISLPHSVSGQAAMGKRISIADAQPGDLVIMSGHDGFYAGNGNIMDAPTPAARSRSARSGPATTTSSAWASDPGRIPANPRRTPGRRFPAGERSASQHRNGAPRVGGAPFLGYPGVLTLRSAAADSEDPMAGTRSAGPLSATGWDECGLPAGSSSTLSRWGDFLACRHHVEACHRHHVACHHHAAATLGAVRTDSALFVSPNARPQFVQEGRR